MSVSIGNVSGRDAREIEVPLWAKIERPILPEAR
jgi:hypothetical protein